jgi:hypothetical protein
LVREGRKEGRREGRKLRRKTKVGMRRQRGGQAAAAGGFSRSLKEQRSKVYIAMRCVVMLLRWHD